jgi:hypothetical protein
MEFITATPRDFVANLNKARKQPELAKPVNSS